MSKKKNTLLRNTSILMAATIISRVIGLLYRSPLGETIGNEGLGYYSTASNLYTILLLISSYSIPMAVSKIVSERLALKEYRNAHRVFHAFPFAMSSISFKLTSIFNPPNLNYFKLSAISS